MNVSALAQRLAGFLALGALALVISACVITSEANLVADGEGATPLPAAFYLFAYGDREGTIIPIADGAMAFTLEDRNLYVSADGSMKAAFVPLGDDGQTFLLSIAGSGGLTYGLARYADNIMEIRMVLDGDAAAELQAAGTAAVPIEDGEIRVADRATLDLVIGLVAEGKLTTAVILAYVAESADATVPPTIVRDGAWYKAV